MFDETSLEVEKLAKLSDGGNDLLSLPLWTGVLPRPISEQIDFFRQEAEGTHWTFWAGWYSSILEGKTINLDLLTRIALLPDEGWKNGAAFIAQRIQQIQAKHLSEHLPLAEQVSVSTDTGLFRVDPVPVRNAPFVGALIQRVNDSLDDCLLSKNGLLDRDREARLPDGAPPARRRPGGACL